MVRNAVKFSSLGPREQSVYFAALRAGQHVVDTDFVADVLAVSAPAAALILSRMQRKRAIERIGHGFYAVVSPETLYGRQRRSVDARLVIDALMRRAGLADCYYVGFQSAAFLHGAAHQIPFALQVVVGRQRRPLVVGETQIRFITATQAAIFGVENRAYQDVRLTVSDRERTALDLVDRPSLGGGIEEVARTLGLLLIGADPAKLAAYARRLGHHRTAQRLGFLIEALGLTDFAETVTALHALVGRNVVPLEPGGELTGPVNQRWKVRANVALTEID